MVANVKQRAIRCVAVIAVALAAGQFVQSTSKPAAKPKLASEALSVKPTKLEKVAAGAEAVTPTPAPKAEPARLPKTPVVAATPVQLKPEAPEAAPPASPAMVNDAAPTIEAPKEMLAQVPTVDPCQTSLDLSLSENAVIGVTLIAACHPNERVTLKHAGLVVSSKTTLTGAIFADMPAFTQSAEIEVVFKDGSSISNKIEVPEVANYRRFAVQWQASDVFLLHGFENGASFGEAGDINMTNPNRPASGLPASAGFLSVLGDSTTENALLAEVYTFPTDTTTKADVIVEAPVTETTCGREMLGETLLSIGGKVTSNELTVSMPECDAIGDYLVLNNLVPDMTIASAE